VSAAGWARPARLGYDVGTMRRWLQLGFLALLAVVTLQLLLRDREPQEPVPPAGAKPPLAPELSLLTLDGTPVDLRTYRGKVVAVNFWASWCGPCKQELPELAQLWRDHHEGCFELLGVAGTSDRQDTERLARSIPYPVLFDVDGVAMDAWQVRSIPRTFVLDAEGRVRQVFRGAIDRQQLTQAVEPLLPASCPQGRSG
jgi:cytochrome c biogenesis protein CcmG, thiol:disulfide interchange protein DsbE